MLEKVETFFRDFISCLQIARLYTVGHPRFNKFIDKAYQSLQEILQERQDLVLGLIGEELAFEKEVLFDLSKSTSSAIIYLKSKGVEKLIFYRGLQKEELSRFIEFLTASKDKIQENTREYLASMGVRNIFAGRINDSLDSAATIHELQNISLVYADTFNVVSSSERSILEHGKLDHLNLKFSLNNIFENLLTRYQEVAVLLTIKRHDSSTFSHSLNVAILAMYFSSRLGFSKDDCLDTGVAALYHDIGKLYISGKIIKKPAKLTDEEFSAMKSHVVLGAEILLEYVESLGILPVVVSLEHHLRHDLTGYPKLRFPKACHLVSSLISICDVYDALCQRRNYKNDYPPDKIYDLMLREKGKYFDPELFEGYFKIMGVWPNGVIVRLSDQRVAVVRDQNSEDIFSPLVEVISPQEQKALINLKDTKETLRIAEFLNPWREGKDFLEMLLEKQLK